jgi:hypothetical protein
VRAEPFTAGHIAERRVTPTGRERGKVRV